MGEMTSDQHQVTVVGGGLAGMAAALHLRRLGCAVRLIEARDHLGGKAGSALIDGRLEDHGYHIFIPFYVNVFRLITDLGIDGNFENRYRFYQLQRGDYPSFHRYWSAPSRHTRLSDLRSGNLSLPDQILYYYTLIDLAGQRYEAADRDESVGDFLRSRWYMTKGVTEELDRLLKADLLHLDEHSSRSLRKAMSFYMRHMTPVYRMALGSLEETFIGPFQRHLEANGVRISTGTRLDGVVLDGDRVGELRLTDATGTVRESVEGDLVLAVPHHAIPELDGATELLDRAGLTAKGFQKLRSNPLSSLHLYFGHEIPDLPRELIRLVDSPHELTFWDLARNVSGLEGSVLNFCFVPGELVSADPEQAARLLVDEIADYIPAVRWDDVKHWVFQPNADAPFFGMYTDSWDNRPDSGTALANLWLAGDYVRSHMDLSLMEAALVTGMNAAEAIRAARGLAAKPIDIRRPRELKTGQAAAIKALLTPMALLAKLAAKRGTQ
jgi:uncharacterized protein with NAD-binding domain and iron-sulfur cluster